MGFEEIDLGGGSLWRCMQAHGCGKAIGKVVRKNRRQMLVDSAVRVKVAEQTRHKCINRGVKINCRYKGVEQDTQFMVQHISNVVTMRETKQNVTLSLFRCSKMRID